MFAWWTTSTKIDLIFICVKSSEFLYSAEVYCAISSLMFIKCFDMPMDFMAFSVCRVNIIALAVHNTCTGYWRTWSTVNLSCLLQSIIRSIRVTLISATNWFSHSSIGLLSDTLFFSGITSPSMLRIFLMKFIKSNSCRSRLLMPGNSLPICFWITSDLLDWPKSSRRSSSARK